MVAMVTQIAGADAAATLHPRRKTYGVNVGHVRVGGGAPIVVQSMTNTDTADAAGTAQQCLELAEAGSEIVRVTVNVPEAAAAVPEIKKRLLAAGCKVPIIGDFHYNGHVLLTKFQDCAVALDRLIGDRLASGQLLFNGVESGGKRLSGTFINELVGRRIEIDTVGQTASEAPDITNFHQHIARELALNGEIDAVALANLEVWIHGKGEIFAA